MSAINTTLSAISNAYSRYGGTSGLGTGSTTARVSYSAPVTSYTGPSYAGSSNSQVNNIMSSLPGTANVNNGIYSASELNGIIASADRNGNNDGRMSREELSAYSNRTNQTAQMIQLFMQMVPAAQRAQMIQLAGALTQHQRSISTMTNGFDTFLGIEGQPTDGTGTISSTGVNALAAKDGNATTLSANDIKIHRAPAALQAGVVARQAALTSQTSLQSWITTNAPRLMQSTAGMQIGNQLMQMTQNPQNIVDPNSTQGQTMQANLNRILGAEGGAQAMNFYKEASARSIENLKGQLLTQMFDQAPGSAQYTAIADRVQGLHSLQTLLRGGNQAYALSVGTVPVVPPPVQPPAPPPVSPPPPVEPPAPPPPPPVSPPPPVEPPAPPPPPPVSPPPPVEPPAPPPPPPVSPPPPVEPPAPPPPPPSNPWDGYDPNSPEGQVINAYRAILGRDPDEGGFQNWLGHMNSGMSTGELHNNFYNSAEYQANHPQPPAPPPAPEPPAPPPWEPPAPPPWEPQPPVEYYPEPPPPYNPEPPVYEYPPAEPPAPEPPAPPPYYEPYYPPYDPYNDPYGYGYGGYYP